MRRLFFPLLAFAALTSACEFHTLDNGSLDGFWQLSRIDTLSGGSCDMVPHRIFWSVQARLLQVSDLNYLYDEYILRFEHADGTLRLYDPYCVDHTGSDIAVTDAADLQLYGLNALDETFQVECLDRKQMLLKGSSLRLHFNKY